MLVKYSANRSNIQLTANTRNPVNADGILVIMIYDVQAFDVDRSITEVRLKSIDPQPK